LTRIIAGAHRGRRLTVPAGQGTRPTSDRVREALFSTLDTLVDLDGARFLDLFAGSGAVGLEAHSRGAADVLLVESDPKAGRAARDNIGTIGAIGRVRLVADRVERVLAVPPDEPYDAVFVDPPYAYEEIGSVLEALVAGWLEPDAVVVVERSTRSAQPAAVQGLTVTSSRRYGETTLWYLRAS
jgi:16S rRNA (guanine(966)-N(2))-methyltransferase RsmD